jgi:hypothetical protein
MILTRVCFAGVGLFGTMTIMPNFMLREDGKKTSIMSSNVGLIASGLFVISGIGGLFSDSFKTYICIGCGASVTQLLAFMIPDISSMISNNNVK